MAHTPAESALARVATAPDAEFIAFQQAIAGRYSLERELGRGGMGIVYLAREVRLARLVAIKLLPRLIAASRPELRERFVREAQMSAQLSHPNIVPIHHVDEIGEFVFFVMAYIEGETLGERIRAKGPLPPTEAARVLREIGWALAYAHLRGIVHRDVKPDNILLERQTNRALVSDFGIAGAARTESTADAGYVRGTVHYLSPEQAAGEAVDERSDLYSLGVLGYYVLTGKLPFEGTSATAVMAAHLTQRPAPIVRLMPVVPRKLADAVERCLEKEPARRWETGEKFAEAVDQAFEQPKEIPAPLRVWLSKAERDRQSRIGLTIFLTIPAMGLALRASPLFWAAPPLIYGALLIGSESLRVRRLLGAGFTLADLRAALRTHWMRRREEFEYEATSPLVLNPRSAAIVAAAGFGVALVASPFSVPPVIGSGVTPFGMIAMGLGLTVGTIGAIAAIIDTVRLRMGWGGRRAGASQLKFWNSAWGERLVRFASFGLKRRGAGAQSALPQYTEVALGRATDALFAALPKHLRKELKDVPDTVRRLESDAKTLRETLDKLDEAIAAAARVARDAGAEHAKAADDRELRRQREDVSDKLAATVAALESIRLGLLRLQIGATPVASVTEALEAASRVGREISIALAADSEVRRALEPKQP